MISALRNHGPIRGTRLFRMVPGYRRKYCLPLPRLSLFPSNIKKTEETAKAVLGNCSPSPVLLLPLTKDRCADPDKG